MSPLISPFFSDNTVFSRPSVRNRSMIMERLWLVWIGLACLLSMAVGCGEEPTAKPPKLGEDWVVLGKIGPEGGKVCAASGLCLQFPPGAVPQSIEVSARNSKMGVNSIFGQIVELRSSVETFDRPIQLTLPVPEAFQKQKVEVGFLASEDGRQFWRQVQTGPGETEAFRIGVTDHLSLWGLLCARGHKFCASVSKCIDVQTDPKHCGQCGNACKSGETCQFGTCKPPCKSGLTACQTGCQDLQVDVNNCGKCGTTCPSGESCQKGVCLRPSCKSGETVCAGKCVLLQSDVAHCGRCRNACAIARRILHPPDSAAASPCTNASENPRSTR